MLPKLSSVMGEGRRLVSTSNSPIRSSKFQRGIENRCRDMGMGCRCRSKSMGYRCVLRMLLRVEISRLRGMSRLQGVRLRVVVRGIPRRRGRTTRRLAFVYDMYLVRGVQLELSARIKDMMGLYLRVIFTGTPDIVLLCIPFSNHVLQKCPIMYRINRMRHALNYQLFWLPST
jgi:hypothetical protein